MLTCSNITIKAQQDYTDTVITDSPAYTIDTQFRALFLKPSANNLYYAAEALPLNETFAIPAVSPNWKIFDLHPKYRFGFDLGLRGVFHKLNSNLSVNWEHFKSHTKKTTTLVSTTQFPDPMIGPFSSIGPDASPYNLQAQGRVKFDFNEVNLRYGQYVKFGNHLETNLFAGISFADIKQRIKSTYTGTGSISQTITVPTSFIGAGPQAGIDFAYRIIKGFNLTGQFTAALLMGRAKNHTQYASSSPVLVNTGNPSPNIQNTSVQNRTQMVPSFSERLALAYFYSFRCHYMAKFEVGFEAKIFLNALQSTNLASGVINILPLDNTAGVYARTFERTVSSFSLSGPYLAFNMAF